MTAATSQPHILICAAMHWPLTTRLAVAFLSHGARVSALCPPGHPLRVVRGLHKIRRYSATYSLASLRKALEELDPDLVIPGDDGVVWQLHDLYASSPNLRPLIRRSLGNPDFYDTVRHRIEVLATAQRLGIRIPSTHIVRSEEDLLPLDYSRKQVLKVDGTWGGNGVSIVSSSEHAVHEFRRLARPTSAPVAIKRRIIDHETLALWISKSGPRHQALIQDFIQGYPANAMMACWNGVVQQILVARVLASQGETGAALVIELIHHHEIEHCAQAIAADLQLSGFYGLDFMIDEADRSAYFIELNPRCTQLGHLKSGSQDDLAAALLRSVRGDTPSPAGTPRFGEIIAFYPQALQWHADSAHLKAAHLDVPETEPALAAELMRPTWPERRWINRAYALSTRALRKSLKRRP